MTVVINLQGWVNIIQAFPLLDITRMKIEESSRRCQKFKIPYPGFPAAILSATYMGFTRGIVRSSNKKYFRNSITIDVSTKEKVVNLKLSANGIQMCGPTSDEMALEAANHLIDNLYRAQDMMDYIISHPKEATDASEWVREHTKGDTSLVVAGTDTLVDPSTVTYYTSSHSVTDDSKEEKRPVSMPTIPILVINPPSSATSSTIPVATPTTTPTTIPTTITPTTIIPTTIPTTTPTTIPTIPSVVSPIAPTTTTTTTIPTTTTPTTTTTTTPITPVISSFTTPNESVSSDQIESQENLLDLLLIKPLMDLQIESGIGLEIDEKDCPPTLNFETKAEVETKNETYTDVEIVGYVPAKINIYNAEIINTPGYQVQSVNSVVIPDEYASEFPDNIDSRIAKFFVDQAPDFSRHDFYCIHLDWLLALKSETIHRPLRVTRILKAMVNHNYDLGFDVDRWKLYSYINGFNGFSARYENTTDHCVTIQLPYEIPEHLSYFIAKKNKPKKHSFLVYRSGLVTQSGPCEELSRDAYNLFNKTIRSLKPYIMKPSTRRTIKYYSIDDVRRIQQKLADRYQRELITNIPLQEHTREDSPDPEFKPSPLRISSQVIHLYASEEERLINS